MSATLPIGLIQQSRLVRAVYSRWLTSRQELPIDVVVEADDVIQYIREVEMLAEDGRPHIVLVEAGRGGDDEYKKIALLKSLLPYEKILIISCQTERKAVLEMLRAGADGYLTTNAEPEDLQEALRTITCQGYYFPEWVIGLLMDHLRDTESGTPHGDKGIEFLMAKDGGHFFIPTEEYMLSEREKTILSLVASEATYADIAEQLCISVRTVQVYVYNLCKKFRVNNRMGLIMQVLKNNSNLS